MIKLRFFKETDIDLLVNFLNDKETTQYITCAIPQPYTVNDAKWWIKHANNPTKGLIIKAIEFNGAFVGCISATAGKFEYHRSAELGYWIGRVCSSQKLWNQGIGTKALSLFIDELKWTTNFSRLFVSVVAENGASIRILEKNGFTLDGLLKQASYKNGEFFDECMMSRILV